MRTLLAILALSSLLPLVGFAEDTVGRLTARDGVRLDGVYLASAGIPSWPVHEGSLIQTGSFPAIVMMGNGQRFNVAANSTAIVESSSAGIPAVKLVGPSGETSAQTPLAAASAAGQVRTSASTPQVAVVPEITLVDDDGKGDLGDPAAGGPPCSDFPPILVTLGLVRCTP